MEQKYIVFSCLYLCFSEHGLDRDDWIMYFKYEVILMFLNIEDFSFQLMTVLDITRGKGGGNSGIRPYHAISFRCSGKAIFSAGSDTATAGPGDFLYIPANYPYHIESTTEEKLFVIHFQTECKMPNYFCSFKACHPNIYIDLFHRLHQAWVRKQPGYQHECKYLIYKILTDIEREHSVYLPDMEERFANIITYIHDHFTEKDLSIAELSNMCAVSDAYFRRQFKQRYSVPPLTYINQLKLRYALELLQSGYYTVTETAEKCGFENIYYFSLFIKRKTGKTPSQWIAG